MKKITCYFRYSLPILAVLLVLSKSIPAQNLPWPYRHAIDSIIARQHVTSETPGIAVCIVKKGQIVYENQAGAANLRHKIPITPKTVFNIGSLSKQFTCMCILLLEEAGQLKRTDDIHRFIPELPDYGYPITIQHLIGHTSGLRSYPELLAMQNKSSNKRLRNQAMLQFQQQSQALNFPPGEDYNYSNTGYMMMCTIVERLSGMTLSAFAQLHIFGPLGMTDTYFQQEGKKGVAGGTASYALKSTGKKFKKEIAFADAIGATGVHTTLRDMVLWDQNFYHNILGKGNQWLIEQMETTEILNSGDSTNYGGGLFLRQRNGFPEVEHTGGWGSFNAQYRRFPQQEISILTAANSEAASAFVLNNAICKVLFPTPSALPYHPQLPPGFSPDQMTGTYLSANNWVRKVQFLDSALYIVMGNSENAAKRRLTYSPSDGNPLLFRDSTNNPVEFYISAGQIAGFQWTGGHYFPGKRNFSKIKSGNALGPASWAGKYHSPDFGKKITIKYHHRTNSLTLHPFPFIKYQLKPVNDSVFEIVEEGFIIRFDNTQLVIGDMWNRGFVLHRKRKR